MQTLLAPFVNAVPAQSHPFKKRKTLLPRSEKKCDACRDRKCKCLPVERDWEKGERCAKCQLYGETCGPHRKHNDPVGAAMEARPEPGELSRNPPPPPQSGPTAPKAPPRPRLAPGNFEPFPPHFRSNDPAQPSFAPTQSGHQTSSSSGSSIFRLGQNAGDSSSTDYYSHGLGRASLSTTHVAFNQHAPQTPPSTPLEAHVKTGFVPLLDLHGLYHALLSRRRQVTQARPLHPDGHFQHFDAALGHHLGLAYNEFASKLISQLENIRALGLHKTQHLRRLLQLAKRFLGQSESQGPASEQHGEKVRKTYVDILLELVHTCSDDGEQEEADVLLLELASLPEYQDRGPDIRSATSQALQRRSTANHAAFMDLEVLATMKLPINNLDNVFPAQNTAIEVGLDWCTLTSTSSNSPFAPPGSNDSLRCSDTIGRGPLHVAIERRNLDLVRCILAKGANLEDRDGLSMTPLLLAALAGDSEVFQRLLIVGAQLEARDRYGRNAIIIACEAGNTAIVQLLIEQNKCNPNESYEIQDCTLLYAAATRGHYAIVQLLLASGANPRRKLQGKYPHHAAREHRHARVADLLEQAMNKCPASNDNRRPGAGEQAQELPAFDPSLPTWTGGEVEEAFSIVMGDLGFDFVGSTALGDYPAVPVQFDPE